MTTMDDPDSAPDGTTLIEPGFARGPATFTRRDGELYLIRTCYEWVCGRWEGFVTMDAAKEKARKA
jgi:hypothetical protein